MTFCWVLMKCTGSEAMVGLMCDAPGKGWILCRCSLMTSVDSVRGGGSIGVETTRTACFFLLLLQAGRTARRRVVEIDKFVQEADFSNGWRVVTVHCGEVVFLVGRATIVRFHLSRPRAGQHRRKIGVAGSDVGQHFPPWLPRSFGRRPNSGGRPPLGHLLDRNERTASFWRLSHSLWWLQLKVTVKNRRAEKCWGARRWRVHPQVIIVAPIVFGWAGRRATCRPNEFARSPRASWCDRTWRRLGGHDPCLEMLFQSNWSQWLKKQQRKKKGKETIREDWRNTWINRPYFSRPRKYRRLFSEPTYWPRRSRGQYG